MCMRRDDDVQFAQDHGYFNIKGLFDTLREYNIHFAQPAITKASWWRLLEPHLEPVGRWTNFIELMVPIISSEAWIQCVHPMIPLDDTSGWGLDVHWHAVCAPLGYCTMAVLDSHVLNHLNGRDSWVPGYDPKREEAYWEVLGRVMCVNNGGTCGKPRPATIKSIERSDVNRTTCLPLKENWVSRQREIPIKPLLT